MTHRVLVSSIVIRNAIWNQIRNPYYKSYRTLGLNPNALQINDYKSTSLKTENEDKKQNREQS
jgi:hypothetical protein